MARRRGTRRLKVAGGVRYRCAMPCKGHGFFGQWSSHQACAILKLEITISNDAPYDADRHRDLIVCSVKYMFGQKSRHSPDGEYMKPHFKPDEMAKMEERAMERFGERIRERQSRENGNAADRDDGVQLDLVKSITREEFERLNKPHASELCERCKVTGVPCTGSAQALSGVFFHIENIPAFAGRNRRLRRKRDMIQGGTDVPSECLRLYYPTSRATAKAIVRAGTLSTAVEGRHGQGLYFSTTPAAARAHGEPGENAVLECIVFTGRVLASTEEDRELHFGSLHQRGFDSVHDLGQDVYVIYNHDQVLSIQLI